MSGAASDSLAPRRRASVRRCCITQSRSRECSTARRPAHVSAVASISFIRDDAVPHLAPRRTSQRPDHHAVTSSATHQWPRRDAVRRPRLRMQVRQADQTRDHVLSRSQRKSRNVQENTASNHIFTVWTMESSSRCVNTCGRCATRISLSPCRRTASPKPAAMSMRCLAVAFARF